MKNINTLKDFLNKKSALYNSHQFIETDPIQIPHAFSKKEDIEIAAFLASTIAWGQRKNIISSGKKLMQLMDNAPFDFITNSQHSDLKIITNFKYRTFQSVDVLFFIEALRIIYRNYSGLESVFAKGFQKENSIFGSLSYFREVFLSSEHLQRSEKHLANVHANSSAKRLNLFLRWMVRNDDRGVDFGIWKNIPSSALMLPLDVHSGNVARSLDLLQRKQNDWLAVEEITNILRQFDPSDPVKYDFALFGIGAFENNIKETNG